MLAAFDAIARPIASVLLRNPPRTGRRPEKILVLELWHMGDVVLVTPALQRLCEMYPGAHITLLAKPHADELLRGSGLVDEIITFDFPWTAMSGKYDPARYDRAAISSLVKRLRAGHFDISLDCRMDLRSNLLTRAAGARRRVGYDFGGGGFLLTDALPAPPADRHKVDDWMALLEPLVDKRTSVAPRVPEPRLTVVSEEREEAGRVLAAHGIEPGEPLVGIHPGGSHDAKRWSADNFAVVGNALASTHGARLLVFVDPDGCGSDMQLDGNALFLRTSIREMMALLTHCDLLLCNDSGPMHIAAALGVPVVAVFMTGNPSAYGPRGINHTVVGQGAAWGSTSDVAVEDVLTAADSRLGTMRAGMRARSETRA